jgi:outer membrane protein assembly factor BamE (lipoprotein component of BamABCDE complex)
LLKHRVFSLNSIHNAQWRQSAALQAALCGPKALAGDIGRQQQGANRSELFIEQEVVELMEMRRAITLGLVAVVGLSLAGCTSIRESRGYVVDAILVTSIQPGIDNQRSVEGTLGRPSFTSQYGEPTWYYVSSVTGRRPFVRPRIKQHSVMAVKFDASGNVASIDRSGIDRVAFLSPDGDETPTLGRERGFLEDLFGNIGQVGAPGAGGPGGP